MRFINSIKHASSVALTLLVLSGVVRAQDSFGDFVVTPQDPLRGIETVYKLEFDLSSDTYARLNDGLFVFEFPNGFGLNGVISVEIESSHNSRQYEVNRIRVAEGNRLILGLERKDDDDRLGEESHRIDVEVTLRLVRNINTAGNYRIAARAYDRWLNRLAGTTNSARFEITDEVIELEAELQIVSTELIAPNSPYVNTNQNVQIEVRLANVSNRDASNVRVGLMSDGGSSFGSEKTVALIEDGDTATVVFDVTAADETGTENFEASFVSGNVIVVEPVDNTAEMVIQTPAVLVLTSNIVDGDTLFIKWREYFSLNFNLQNVGESSVGVGRYQLSGFDSHGGQTGKGGPMYVNTELKFTELAPPYDEILNYSMAITQVPVDSNTLLPASIENTEITFTVLVRGQGISTEESFTVENNPFNPIRGPVTFAYNLDSDSDVEFRIFTVTGEQVYAKTYASGTEGGKAGTNQIEWDGRNTNRDIVLNGVYVTMLNVVKTGQQASLKLAVMK